MRKTGFLLICLATILSACGGGERAASNASANRTSTYSASAPSTQPAISRLDESEKTTSNASTTANSNASSVSTRVAKRQHLSVGQQVSLIRAEQVSDSEYNVDRKVVRNAELDLESESPEQSQQKITSIAEMKGGFVVESQQSMSDIKSASRDIVSMTLRVPSDKFGEALEDIGKTASRVVSESVKGEDVTEEFIDVEAQLKAKKALETQFMEIMKRAARVEEALEVQSELADVRGEIEKIEGRKRFLENKSSLSTIKIRLQTAQVIASSTQGFGGRFVEAFDAGMKVATSFVLGVVTFLIAILPFALLIGLPTVLAFRYFWKRQTRPKSVSEIAREEIT